MLTGTGSSNTTDAFEISLHRGKKQIAVFNPDFTYPIFGEEEVVFGYRGLKMALSFAAHNLQSHMDISWDEQWQQRGDIKASDVHAALEDFVPEEAFSQESQSLVADDTNASDFIPPGDRITSYKIGEEQYEIWLASLSDGRAKEIMVNAQVLVPLFIEGGTILQLDHDWVTKRWRVFLLYRVHEKQPNTCPYSLVGFATSYCAFTLPASQDASASLMTLLNHDGLDFDSLINPPPSDSDVLSRGVKSPLDLPSRERISQFLILPPYQGAGHGAALYNSMYRRLIAPDNVLELTIEDPNEAFDDLRDACDLVFLRENNDDFAELTINTKVDQAKLKPTAVIPVDDIVDGAAKARIKKASKIMPRQLARLVEMQTFSKIPPGHRSVNRISRKEKSSNDMDRAYFFWRLYVKARLYAFNRDTLIQMDREDRIEKLEETMDSIQSDYERLLALADKRARQASNIEIASDGAAKKSRKRKVVVDDDEDSDDSTLGPAAGQSAQEHDSATKKRRHA